MIHLQKAVASDCPKIHELQVRAFMPLLEKYQDFETNPAAEGIDRVFQRFAQPFTNYYLIIQDDTVIGMMRVCDFGEVCRISPICILPAYQGRHYAQQAIIYAEQLYPNARQWELDTILQEEKLCHFYEKMGYVRTGEYRSIKAGMDLVYYRKQIK